MDEVLPEGRDDMTRSAPLLSGVMHHGLMGTRAALRD